MKQILQQYAAYNIWASERIFNCIKSLSEEKINQEINSSFPSIRETVLHGWNAESLWWQRLKLSEKIIAPADSFSGLFDEMEKMAIRQSQEWKAWIDAATELQLQHVFAYQNNKKEQFKQPVYEMILHVFNHGTYHRGQLVTLLRQLGIDKIPPTDFIVFCRKK